MSQELTLEMVVGQPNVLTQEQIKQALEAAGYDPVDGSWSPDLEQTTEGLAILADSGTDNITVIPSKSDVYELFLVNDEYEITFMITASEEKADAVDDGAAEQEQSSSNEANPTSEETVSSEETSVTDETETQSSAPTANVEQPSAPAAEQYTPPAASEEYNADSEFDKVVNITKTQLDEYSAKMHRKAVLTVDIAVRMQMKLLSTILGALNHGGRKTELAMRAIMEDFAHEEKSENVYKTTLINRYVDETFRTKKQRELFKDLVTLLSIGSKVGRMNVTNHFDVRRLEQHFDNPKHYANLCTFFAVKD